MDIVGENSIALSFSGGGLRAAAFAHGVLKALEETKTANGDLTDDIAFLTSVSGGSLTAAHFGLYGREGLATFRENVLLRDFEADMRLSVANPSNLLRIFGGGLNARENFGDALTWSAERGDTATGLRLAARLGRFWERRGFAVEGLTLLERILARSRDRAEASLGAGYLTSSHQAPTRTFMSPVVVHFTSVFFLSAVALFPSHRAGFFAALIGAIALIGITLSTWITVKVVRTDMTNHVEDYFAYGMLPSVGYLALIAAAASIYLEKDFGLDALAGALLLLTVVNIRNAWDLVLSMVRRPRKKG